MLVDVGLQFSDGCVEWALFTNSMCDGVNDIKHLFRRYLKIGKLRIYLVSLVKMSFFSCCVQGRFNFMLSVNLKVLPFTNTYIIQ